MKARFGLATGATRRPNHWYTDQFVILCCCLHFALCGCGSIVETAGVGVLSASPSKVTFGAVAIGQTARTNVTILNSSSAPAEITQLTLTGGSFSILSPRTAPFSIAAGGTYSVGLQFSPAVAGTATGQVTVVTTSSIDGTTVISLAGTGTAVSPALSALSCSSGAMTGSGTDACTVTLSTSAPSGGQIVNLSSSSSAVTLPSTVTIPAGAASAGFTATVSSVATAQAVTMTASASGMFTSFTLQLNAAILALSINATSVAFGDVLVNTPATQSVTMTSTGTVPVTINGATLTGAGFTVSGIDFPATLSPSQEATLNLEFDPTTAGTATGQLTIASNSSTNGTAAIVLSGIGTAAPVVAVAVTPTTASITTGASQQFAASVTGTSNTAVTWTVSGAGCSGATCGTISSAGLYSAPAAVPSPGVVTIKATSASDPTKSASASVTILPTPGTTYYLAPASAGGNDSNNGLSPGSPWLSPNHSVNCGDVIIAAASASYSSAPFETGNWGTVTCAAGNNVAWLKCATFDACKITASSGQPGFYVDKSYWGVQGWEVTAPDSTSNWCFGAAPNYTTPVEIHHIIFADNVANGCQQGGFVSFNQNTTSSVDYLVILANIVYNAAQGSTNCYSGISIYQPIQSDSLPGTHIYVAGNFSWGNFDPNPCADGIPTDGEGIIFDTFDGSQGRLPFSYGAQAVAENNILVANGGRGIQAGNNSIGTGPFASIYFSHNTMWGNNGDPNHISDFCGEMLFYATFTTQASWNLAATNAANGCGANPIYAYFVGDSATITDQVSQNWGFSPSGTNGGVKNSAGFVYLSTNTFGVNPSFANPTVPGAPSCSNYASVSACMATLIANFTPTNAAAVGYGYQVPSATQVYDPLFPQWLCNVNLPSGLVTMGCEAAP